MALQWPQPIIGKQMIVVSRHKPTDSPRISQQKKGDDDADNYKNHFPSCLPLISESRISFVPGLGNLVNCLLDIICNTINHLTRTFDEVGYVHEHFMQLSYTILQLNDVIVSGLNVFQ